MAKFTDPRALAQHHKRRTERVYRSMLAASEEAGRIAREEAEKLTSGTVGARELRGAGHPFARDRTPGSRFAARGVRGASAMRSYPLVPVSAQTGALRRSWRLFRRPGPEKGSVAFQLQNIAPHSKFVLSPEGTATAVARPVFAELNRRVLPKLRRRRLDLWRAALRG